jgi:hypothetical protein
LFNNFSVRNAQVTSPGTMSGEAEAITLAREAGLARLDGVTV